MASLPPKAKKHRTKPSKSRPPATNALSQPPVDDVSTSAILSAFSPAGDLFALLSQAVDKHILRVYEVTANQSIAEHSIDDARVTTLVWVNFDLSDGQNVSPDELPSKKRKKRDSVVADTGVSANSLSHVRVLALGLSDGTVQFFSPTHGRVLRTLSHPSSTTSILKIAPSCSDRITQVIWTSSNDGTLRLWNARTNEIIGSWKYDDRIPHSAMAIRSVSEEDDRTELLIANHSIHLLASSSSSSSLGLSGANKPKQLCSFTGHASSVNCLSWDDSFAPPNRFFSTAERDRFIHLWELPDAASTEGKMVASIPLDSDVQHISLANLSGIQTLLALSASGKVTISPIPSELGAGATSRNAPKHKIPTLLPRSTITLSVKKRKAARIITASFLPGQEGQIQIACLAGGVRPTFEVVKYLDSSGDFIPEYAVKYDDAAVGTVKAVSGVLVTRYSEPSSLRVETGEQLGQDPKLDDLADRDVDGDLNVDLAELSLGQRLTALSDLNGKSGHRSSGSEQEQASELPVTDSKRPHKLKQKLPAVPVNSLTRTLIQALHSSDSGLLETCLAHSDEALIRNTVRRLPPQLAVPLLTACVERLGRGGRAGNMKGRGGGASSQRGTGLITWVKAVLAVHSAHLMTLPDLVARLSTLHTTLTTRLTLQERLLSLSGRLDLVLSQIEMRSSIAPAPLVPHKKNKTAVAADSESQPQRYIEGESSEEEERMVIEVDEGDDNGSLEDVQFGDDSQEEDEEGENSSGDEDGDDDEDYQSPNGFLDNEAEEDNYGEDESDEESE